MVIQALQGRPGQGVIPGTVGSSRSGGDPRHCRVILVRRLSQALQGRLSQEVIQALQGRLGQGVIQALQSFQHQTLPTLKWQQPKTSPDIVTGPCDLHKTSV